MQQPKPIESVPQMMDRVGTRALNTLGMITLATVFISALINKPETPPATPVKPQTSFKSVASSAPHDPIYSQGKMIVTDPAPMTEREKERTTATFERSQAEIDVLNGQKRGTKTPPIQTLRLAQN